MLWTVGLDPGRLRPGPASAPLSVTWQPAGCVVRTATPLPVTVPYQLSKVVVLVFLYDIFFAKIRVNSALVTF